MNKQAGVWVKAETLKEIRYGYDAAMACVNEFKIPLDHPDPGAAADCINMAKEGYEFMKKVTAGLDEQPIRKFPDALHNKDKEIEDLKRDAAYWNLEAHAKFQEIERLKGLIESVYKQRGFNAQITEINWKQFARENNL